MSDRNNLSRREWMSWATHGLAGAALTDLFAADRPVSAGGGVGAEK